MTRLTHSALFLIRWTQDSTQKRLNCQRFLNIDNKTTTTKGWQNGKIIDCFIYTVTQQEEVTNMEVEQVTNQSDTKPMSPMAAALEQQKAKTSELLASHSPIFVVAHEAMNPSKRCSMEDSRVFHAPGDWDAPDPDLALLGVYDGHGGRSPRGGTISFLKVSTVFVSLIVFSCCVGRDMVDYLEHGLSFHIAQELHCDDDATTAMRLERAFLIADVHSRSTGITMSGATVAVCLVKVSCKKNYSVRLDLSSPSHTRIIFFNA
jgi:hypothetical protein